MKYRGTEAGLDTSKIVSVHRAAEEVFAPASMASLEGKPVVGPGHPSGFVSPQNVGYLSKGHVQNVRRGTDRLATGEEVLLADLIITDGDLIDKILNGMRGVSVGYNVLWEEDDDGDFHQSRIRANHLAIVEEGRGGEDIRIYDHCIEDDPDAEFEAIAKQYHRQNVGDVDLTSVAQDGLVEEMLASARPRLWSELARELHQNMNQSQYDIVVQQQRDAEAEDFENLARAQRQRMLGRK
jgi:hypothetical protein